MGEKQFNFRLACWLIAMVAVCAVVVQLLHAYQMQRHAHTLQEQAKRAEEAHQTEQAAALLKRYLLFAPDDTDALLHYGETLQKLPADPRNRWLAVAAFEQVLARAPQRHEVRERLVALLLDLEAYSDAREQIEIQLHASPKNARLEGRLARCLEEDGDYEQALKTYEKAIEHDPAQVECYTRQAVLLYNHFGQPETADAVMDQLIAANDKNFAAYYERCLYRMGRGWLDKAAQDMAVAKKLAPTDARVLVTAAELAYRCGLNDDARAAWNEGLKEHPETLNMYLGLATLEIADKRPKEAVACLRRGLEKYPDNTDLLHLLTEAYLTQNDVKSAEEVETQVRRAGGVAVADYLRTLILLHRGRWGAALPLLEKALESQDLPKPLACRMQVCLAQCYERLGDNDRCLAAYRRAVFLEPSHLPANLGLAAALLAAGKGDEVLSQYRPLARTDRPPEEVWLLLGRTLLQRNQALPPNNRTWDEIERALQRAEKNEALLVPTAILRTDVLLAQGKPDEARKALEQARDCQPDKPALWTALANLTARRGDLAGAERILSAARAKVGDRFELRMTALELGVGLDDRDAKAKLLAYEKDLQQYTPEEQRRLLAALAEIHYRLDSAADGERLTRELASRQPLDLPAAIVVLELALLSRDDGLQTRAVAEVRRLEGDDGTWWRYGEARRQLSRTDFKSVPRAADEVRRLLAEITKARPDWSRAALLEAALCELNRDAAGAIGAYTKAFEQGDRQPWVVIRLMDLLVAQGRFVDADDVMSKAQQQVIPHGAFARFAAETALRVRQYERATTLARLAIPSDSRNPWDFIWLGQLLAAAERRPEAEEALRHAVELRETVRDTWVALITFYANNDQVKEADDAIKTMTDKLPPAQTPLALALCEEALGRLELAEQHYLEARTKQPSDGLTQQRLAAFYVRLQQTGKAAAALRDLLDPTLRFPRESGAESVAWARRQLALLRADSGDAGYAEALMLLEANGNRSVADVRATAFVKATRAKERAEALHAIEETMKIQPLAPDEQFRLAMLYEAEDDWHSARDQLAALLKVDRRNPEYLAYFIAALLRHHEDAQTWLAKLAKLEPGSARVKKWQAELK